MAARDPLRLSFADQIVTSDAARFQRTKEFLTRHPQLRLAGPTWGWVGGLSLAGGAGPPGRTDRNAGADLRRGP